MPIKELKIANFKGIAGETALEILPITIFVGANSSGKSTCIHGLTALSQTLKLGNSAPSLVLDDEFAHVHLGRFVEIAHSHSYADSITLGVDVGVQTITVPRIKSGGVESAVTGPCRATYEFRSTMRTQEVYVDSAKVVIGNKEIVVKRASKKPYGYLVSSEPLKGRIPVRRRANFLFDVNYAALGVGVDFEQWWETIWIFEQIQRVIEGELRDTVYLGPFRQSPLRRYPFRGASATEVGPQGEATVSLLASEHVKAKSRAHAKQINGWLTAMNLAKTLELSRVGTSDLFDVSLKLADGNTLPIADLGYGLSQVLPVLTQCSYAAENSTLLFEQPELHLHEGAARRLAPVFLETARSKGANIVLETHSKDLIHEFMALVKSGDLPVEKLALYVATRAGGASSYKRAAMTWDGDTLWVDDPWFQSLA